MPEAVAGRQAVALRVGLEKSPLFGLAGRLAGGDVLGQEAELLHQAAAHDDVALVKGQAQRLPVVDFLADELLDQTLQLVLRRCPA